MQHRIELSTDLLIVLSANKKIRSQQHLKPAVKGIKINPGTIVEKNQKSLRVDCFGEILMAEPLLEEAFY